MRYYRDNLDKRYSTDKCNELLDILNQIGLKIGAKYRDEIDYDKVYDTVIKDLRDGLLGRVTFDIYEDR